MLGLEMASMEAWMQKYPEAAMSLATVIGKEKARVIGGAIELSSDDANEGADYIAAMARSLRGANMLIGWMLSFAPSEEMHETIRRNSMPVMRFQGQTGLE